MERAVRMSVVEAIAMLRKWMEENRPIHLTFSAEPFTAKILGRIDSVEPMFHLSLAKTSSPLGEYVFMEFPIEGCEFDYCDAAHCPEPLRSKLKGYDALLMIFREGRARIAMAILPDEERFKF